MVDNPSVAIRRQLALHTREPQSKFNYRAYDYSVSCASRGKISRAPTQGSQEHHFGSRFFDFVAKVDFGKFVLHQIARSKIKVYVKFAHKQIGATIFAVQVSENHRVNIVFHKQFDKIRIFVAAVVWRIVHHRHHFVSWQALLLHCRKGKFQALHFAQVNFFVIGS